MRRFAPSNWSRARSSSTVSPPPPSLLQAVRYFHLNPRRAKLVGALGDLERYPEAGPSALLGQRENAWQDTGGVLGRFGGRGRAARSAYRAFVAAIHPGVEGSPTGPAR